MQIQWKRGPCSHASRNTGSVSLQTSLLSPARPLTYWLVNSQSLKKHAEQRLCLDLIDFTYFDVKTHRTSTCKFSDKLSLGTETKMNKNGTKMQ